MMLGTVFVRGLTNTTLVLRAGWGLWLLIGGKFFGGYSGTYWRSDGRRIDSISEAVRGIAKRIPNLHGVEFRTGNYKNLLIPDESIIYCDPLIWVPQDIQTV